MLLTSREQQHFMLQQSEVEWRCAGHYCRKQGAGCSIRRTTVASHHWIDRSFCTKCIHCSIFPLCIQSNMSPPPAEQIGIGCIFYNCTECSLMIFPQTGTLLEIKPDFLTQCRCTTTLCKQRWDITFRC